jgi:HlyD family secretion protein
MDPPDRIFRQAALDRLSSPEQLDQLMQITTPKSWLALLAFGVLLLMALVWGIFGEIPTRVMGRGIYLKSGGVFVVAARGEGNVLELLVRARDAVKNNQLLARISQEEIKIKLSQATTNLSGLAASLQEREANQKREEAMETDDLSEQKEMFNRTMTNCQAQIAGLMERTNFQKDLSDKGLISKAQYLDTVNALYAAQYDLYHAQLQDEQLGIVRFQAKARRAQLYADRKDQVQQVQNQVEYLSSMYTLNTEVRSPYQGEVLEVRVKQGDLITANTPIATLQSATNKLEAHLYLSSADGKVLTSRFQPQRAGRRLPTAKPGAPLKPMEPMPVLLAPVSVKKEEYGLMRGTVEEASEYPVTPEGMLRILGNPTLVAEFAQAGALIEVTVRLQETNNTTSGFVWTSVDGPPMQITSGTLCEGTITIGHRAPIIYVLPFLMKKAHD